MTEQERKDGRVLVLAPTGRDSHLLSEMLGNQQIVCLVCRTVISLADEIRTGAALIVLAEEALVGTPLKTMLEALEAQPNWSDIPLLFLSTGGTRPSEESVALLDMLGEKLNITILERPVRMATLLSSVRSGLRARRRQYQVRDSLLERERERENLLQTQKLESLGVLAGGVAHDFNNLLTGILGNSSLALEILPPGCDDARLAIKDAIVASERAADLTKQLLAYAGKGKFVIAPVDLSNLVQDVAHLIHSAVSKNAFLRFELSENLPSIEADRTQLQQIIMNLIINAAESIPSHASGEVSLRTYQQNVDEETVAAGNYVVLEVSDTGSGMDEATLARIFDPFFTTKFTGRGLGLAAVQGIVRGHKGLLRVKSTPGLGSTFQILFPAIVSETPHTGSVETLPKERNRTGLTVLIIDDEAVIRRTAAAALKRYGYETVAADGGEEGLALFAKDQNRFAAVLLDLTMPGLGGEEVFSRIRAIKPTAKVIISSGFNEVEVVQRFSGKGLTGFVQKPYSASTLAAAFNRVL